MTMISLEGFDSCVAGIAYGAGEPDRLVYDTSKVYTLLMNEMDMTFNEAIQFFDNNVMTTAIGPGAPLFVTFASMDEIKEVHCGY